MKPVNILLKVGEPIEVAEKISGKRFFGVLVKIELLEGGKKIWKIAVQNGKETKREISEFPSSHFTLIAENQHSIAYKAFLQNQI